MATTAIVRSAVAEVISILSGFFLHWPDAGVDPTRPFWTAIWPSEVVREYLRIRWSVARKPGSIRGSLLHAPLMVRFTRPGKVTTQHLDAAYVNSKVNGRLKAARVADVEGYGAESLRRGRAA